ncbi:hypothetical protein D3C87_2158280 [compost metagenome]
MNLVVAQRAAAGVFIDVVVKFLEFVTEARCCAFTATRVSTDDGAYYLASGF